MKPNIKLLPRVNFLLILFFCISCDNENSVDFRDKYVGKYICMETFTHLLPGEFISWETDTNTFLAEVIISKSAEEDSSLIILFGDNTLYRDYEFEAPYSGNNKFTCKDCSGPDDYVEFLGDDSVYVYRKIGVTNNCDYYGIKN
jgi:hypothetical protein